MIKPMLAGKLTEPEKLRFPVLVSPKLDGVRALIVDGQVMSRDMKLIPNLHVQSLFGHANFNGLDGELILGNPCSKSAFRDTSSAVMSRDGRPQVRFHVFDDFESVYDGFYVRWKMLKQRVKGQTSIVVVDHQVIADHKALAVFEAGALDAGYEGAMIRATDGPYKHGRSTEREGYLLKMKRFDDAEARIIGFDEKMHNANAKNARGKRTSHQVGLVPTGTLGALKVVGINGTYEGVEFDVGTGFTDEERARIWSLRPQLMLGIIKFKFFPGGAKDKPRFPTYLGFRDERDR